MLTAISTAVRPLRSAPPVPRRVADEAGLIAALRSGDESALGPLYERYAAVVYGAAHRITGSQADAEDVLQDVFVGLPEALRRYDERGRLASWLRGVAVRTALMKLRSRRRLREETLDSVEAIASAANAPSITDRITARLAIKALPDSLRVVFILKEVEGYSHAEIAEMLGVSSGASAARLLRAWRALLGAHSSRETSR